MQVFYIAGPFRDDTPRDVEENIRKAERTALRVAKAGYVPLVPHPMYRYFDKSLPDEFWLEGTLELLRRADGIIMSEGWEESEGSCTELGTAQARRMAVFRSIEEFEAWASQQGTSAELDDD